MNYSVVICNYLRRYIKSIRVKLLGFERMRIAIEGNIGCGKSTFIEYFKQYPEIEATTEPVNHWSEFGALQVLYDDPQRWGLAVNSFCLLSRCSGATQDKPISITERSLCSTRHVFVENAYRFDGISNLEYTILVEWYNRFMKFTPPIDLYVYLNAPPELCLLRVRARGRKEESLIDLGFLERLHLLYDAWLLQMPPSKVIRLDVSGPLNKVVENYESFRKILNLHSLQPLC